MKASYPKKTKEIQARYYSLLEDTEAYFNTKNQKAYLKEHPEVAALLEKAAKAGVIKEYNAIVQFINLELNTDLASILERETRSTL